MALSSGTRLGPYEILSPLGAGGMGEVYRARDARLGREVAVKVLPTLSAGSPEALLRFEREAQAVAALSHPNVLSLHDFGKDGDVSYAVMELLEGETLRERLSAAAIPPRKAVDYAQQMARGLAAAHDRGIVHRDLKPDNVFLTRDGLVKILDFGLARPADVREAGGSGSQGASLTASGTVVGTPGYMSPEQIRGKPVDQRSDLFALGVILYEMLTGVRAFQGDNAVETMMAVLQTDPPLSAGRGVPPELSEIVLHSLEKSPEDRFQSARDLAFALQREPSSPQTAGASATTSGAGHSLVASIAVLPFRNMSTGADAEYFSDGMTEEIINALAGIDALQVASRTSAFAFKGKDTDIRQIGRDLGVGTVLEGSVRQAGQRLRITAQLIDVSNGYHLWSERFDREMQDVFAVQDEIALAIAAALKVRLLPAQEASLVAPGTRDIEAYNRYLKGRYFFNQRASKKAIAEFEAAVAADPRFALAYTGLADAYGTWGFYGGVPTLEASAKARAAVRKAQELEPDSADVHIALGIFDHYYGWDMEREEQHFRRAIELAPKGAEAYSWLACQLSLIPRTEEALEAGRRAVELEPLSANVHVNAAWPHFWAQRYDLAIDGFHKALEVDSSAVYALWALGMACQAAGRHEEGISALEKLSVLTGREMPWSLCLLASCLATSGRSEAARAVLAEIEGMAARQYVPPLHLAFARAGLGEADAAFELLSRAIAERNTLCWAWPRLSPVFATLRAAPGFPQLLAGIHPE
ncbi:MAG TPA: protein kinase [Thermoanaerobaculia bacterium]|nr:protein kinase [Thermoanaerobaculia bacterium]